MASDDEITTLARRWSAGDEGALEELIALTYPMIEGTSPSRVTDISSNLLAADVFFGADGPPATPLN